MGFEGSSNYASLFDPTLAELAVREMADAAGAAATERARELAPVGPPFEPAGRAPGTLRASYVQAPTRPFVEPTGRRGWESGVESFDHVARWVEHGVAPHTVRAKRGRYLTFRTIDGRTVRARFVRQPGYAGQHVVARALHLVESEFPVIAEGPLRRWRRRQLDAARHG